MAQTDDPVVQRYEYSFPQVWPDGSEFSVYSTKGSSRMVIKHASGSHIEFKPDGSIFIKALGDINLNSSTNEAADNRENSSAVPAQRTTIVVDTDLDLEVKGDMGITCSNFSVTAANDISHNSGGNDTTNSNNIISKSTEQTALESSKSVYLSTKEYVENVTKRTSSIGEPGAASAQVGGQNTMDVMGNTVIRNLDPMGGITIQSAGYLNLVCGAERVDVTGDPSVAAAQKLYLPSIAGKATYTHTIGANPGPNPRGIPGSYMLNVGPGGMTTNCVGFNILNVTGITKETYKGTKTETVSAGSLRKITGF